MQLDHEPANEAPAADPATAPAPVATARRAPAEDSAHVARVAEQVYDLLCDRLERERDRRGL
jgi:hypothetical protein